MATKVKGYWLIATDQKRCDWRGTDSRPGFRYPGEQILVIPMSDRKGQYFQPHAKKAAVKDYPDVEGS